MAKKKTDKLDNDFDFGDDDFNFDDMDASMSMDSKPKKDRGIVSDVFSGTISGIKSKFTDPEFIGEGVRKSMPKSFDYFTEGVDSAAKNFAGTYNDAVKELKPQVASIASNLNKIIPEHLKGVKKLSDKFDKFMNGEGSRATSTENIEGQLVSNTLSAVFGNQDKKADEERAADKADQKVKDIIDDKRFRSSNAILGRIADATSRSTSLQESVGIGYMKKSLELQVRQLFTLQNLTDKSVKFQEIAARQYESIVKNTSMPEFVKLKESERFKQLAKDKFYGGIQGNLLQMTGLGKMSERMRKDARDYVSGIKNGLMATNDGLEMIKDKIQEIEELKDSGLNISKAEMLGQLLGGGISVKARSLVTDAIKKALSKDAKVDKAGNRLSTMALNAGGYAKRYKNKDSFQDKLYSEGITGKFYSALNYILGTGADEGGDFKLKAATSIASINEPGTITNKFIRSVEEVIPTWLAHIHRELIITRTGEVKTELGRFDFTKGVLISKSEATRKVTDRLNKDADNLMHRSNVDKTYSNFVGDAEVDPSIEKELKSFIVKLSREKNTVYDSEGISNTKHFKNLSPEAKKQVSKLLEKYETNDDSLEKSRKELELTSDMSDTRKSTTDIRASIEEMMKTYGVDVLLDEGIVEYDASGALQINEDKYYQILETGRLATSDKNKKKNIKPFGGLRSRFAVSDINAKEDISKPKGSFLDKVRDTGVFSWMYKDGKGDGDPHVGPMAQDVKKNMGEEAAPGGKKIDLVNLNGINMAATQELADRVDNGLNINAEGISYAKSTSDSLIEILAILKDKKFFTLGLPEGFDIGKLDIKGKASKALAAGKEAVGTAAGMAKGAAKGAVGGAKGTAKWLNDVIFSPGLNYLNKDETKEKITKTLGDVADSALGLGSFLVKQMNKTVTERIPAVIKTVKDKAKKFFDFLYDGIIETPDLYIKGKKEAVILINRLKAGDYYDSVTGKVLTTLKDIEQCKGDILDRGGKIVATAAEASQGFVDRMGNVVKRKAVNALQLGIAVGTKVIGAGLKAAKNVGSRVGKMLGLNDGKFDNFKDAISDAFKDMNLMGGSGVSNEAIIDIRDLLFKLHPKEALEIEKAKKNAKGDEVKRHKGIIQSVKNLFKQEQKEEKAVHAAEVNSENAVKAEEGSASVAGNSGNGPGVPGGQFGKLTAKAKDYFNTKDEDGSTKGDKLKAGATNLKDKVLGSKMGTAAKGRFSKAGKFLSKIPGSGKVATLAKGAGGLLGKGLGVAGGMFSSFMGGGDAAETGTEDTSDNTKAEAGRSFKADNKGLSVNKTGPIAFNDKDGNGRRDGAFEDRLAEANKEKEERLKKKSLEKGEMKYRNKGNVIDKLMGLFAGSFGKIAGAATSLIGKFLGKGGLLAKSLGWLKGGKLFTKLLGLGKILGIGGSIAAGAGAAGSVAESVGDAADLASTGSKATKATTVASKVSKVSKFGRLASLAKNALGIGSAVSTAASVAGSVGTAAAGTAAAGTAAAGTAAAATGTAAAAGGAAASGGLMASFGAALLSPLAIGVAVVGVVVGGYYLYKYLTRNSVDDYEEARMYQYGFGHTEDSKSHFGKLLALEAYLQDGRTGYNKDKTYIISKKIDPKELYEFFKIDPKDSVKLTEFNDWFNNRFVPVYLYHTKTLYDINNKAKLDGISSLKLDEKLKYLESAAFESAPYSVTSSPVKDVAILNSDPSLAKKKIDEIRAKVITKNKKSTNIDLRNKKTNIDFVDKKEADKELAKNNAKAEREVISAIKPASPLASTSKAAPIANALGAGEDGPQDKLGEGKAVTDAGSSITYAPSSIPAASGNLKDGSGGTAFMKFSSKSVSIDSMNPEMKKRLLGMIQEYGELTGKNITVNSGSRTTAQQAALYRQNPAKAAKPGRSLHEFGLAVDINSVDANKLDEMGLMRKYGFTRPVGGETWHVEPVGIQGRIGDVKADAGLASSLVAAGEGYGGGGIGSIKGSKLGSRDPNGSKGVFAASNKNVTNKQKTDTGTSMPPKAVVADSSSVPSGGSSSSSSSGTETTSIMKTGLAGAPSSYSGTTTSGAPTAPADNIANSMAEPEAKPSDSAGAVASTGPSSSSKGTGVEGAIEEGSKKTGMDPSMMKAFAAVESSMNPNAAARTSSAKGLYQFLDATWNEQVKKNARKHGLQANANRFDPYTSTVIAGEYLKTNLKGVSSIKKDTNIVDAYLTHFLGPGGARTFLSASPTAIAAEVMPKAAKANTNIFYNGGKPRTISEVYNYLKDKIAAKAKSFGITLGNVTGMGSKPSGNTNTGEMGIGGGNTGGSQASAAPSGKPSTSTPSIANPSTVSKVDPNSSKGPGFTRIDPVADNSSVNTSVSPSRDASSPESGMSVLVDVNKQQLQVFSAMFEYLKAELPKLGVKQEVQEPSTRVQDVAKQQAANQTSAGTVDNTKPSRNEIPPPSVSMGRRPFA